MRDEAISQEEIDALVRGIMGQSSTPATASPKQNNAALEGPFREFIESAGRALGDLMGTTCQAALAEISSMSVSEIASLNSGQVLVSKTELVSGLNGIMYYIMPPSLGLAIVTQLYGGVAPSSLDESALGALAEGVSQLNQAGLARLAQTLGYSVIAHNVEVFPVNSIMEVPGVSLGASVLVVSFELAVENTSGRIMILFPSDAASALSRAKPAASPAKAASASNASSMASVASHATQMASSVSPMAASSMPAYQPAQFPDLTPRPPREEIRNIDLLMDVTLQVTVELGRTRRQIRDVLALGPGSVVELDKLAGEQVDVLVNGKLIAKGEVVVIDENYGVRITDIINPSDRVQSLK